MISRDDYLEMRRRAEHPERPLVGGLAVTNSDTGCDWCRGQRPDDEDGGAIFATEDGVYEYRGARLVPTFHPAYLLRNPGSKREVWEDMKLVRELIKK